MHLQIPRRAALSVWREHRSAAECYACDVLIWEGGNPAGAKLVGSDGHRRVLTSNSSKWMSIGGNLGQKTLELPLDLCEGLSTLHLCHTVPLAMYEEVELATLTPGTSTNGKRGEGGGGYWHSFHASRTLRPMHQPQMASHHLNQRAADVHFCLCPTHDTRRKSPPIAVALMPSMATPKPW